MRLVSLSNVEPQLELIEKKSNKQVEVDIVNFLTKTNQYSEKNKKMLEEKSQGLFNKLTEFLLEINYRDERGKGSHRTMTTSDKTGGTRVNKTDSVENIMKKSIREKGSYVEGTQSIPKNNAGGEQQADKLNEDANKSNSVIGKPSPLKVDEERAAQKSKLSGLFSGLKKNKANPESEKPEDKFHGVIKASSQQPQPISQPISQPQQQSSAIGKSSHRPFYDAQPAIFDEDYLADDAASRLE